MEGQSTVKAELWARVEIFGHRTHYGRISEVEQFSAKMMRVDVPTADGAFETHIYGGAAIFGMQPMTEEKAREEAAYYWPRPFHPTRALPAGSADSAQCENCRGWFLPETLRSTEDGAELCEGCIVGLSSAPSDDGLREPTLPLEQTSDLRAAVKEHFEGSETPPAPRSDWSPPDRINNEGDPIAEGRRVTEDLGPAGQNA